MLTWLSDKLANAFNNRCRNITDATDTPWGDVVERPIIIDRFVDFERVKVPAKFSGGEGRDRRAGTFGNDSQVQGVQTQNVLNSTNSIRNNFNTSTGDQLRRWDGE